MKCVSVNFTIQSAVDLHVPNDMVNDSDIWDALMDWYNHIDGSELLDAISKCGEVELINYFVDE